MTHFPGKVGTRDVGGRLHNLARHYHSCRNRKWTDRCGRGVCLEQVAGHNRTFSLHNGAHQLDWISFSDPRLHARFGCRNCGLCDHGRRAVCFVQRAPGRRMAVDLRNHRCCVALSQRLRFGRAELREGFGSQCVGSDADRTPFAVTQAAVLAIFILIALIAVIKFRPPQKQM
jgi:hypothetical protein